MKRLLGVLGLMASLNASAGLMYYLQWDSSDYYLIGDLEAHPEQIKSMVLYAKDASGTSYVVETITPARFKDPGDWAAGRFESDISGFVDMSGDSEYTFYVNLYGEEVMGEAEILYNGELYNSQAFDDLRQFLSDELDAVNPQYWSAITPVPEPSSGVLSLLGLALLGLRRKRRMEAPRKGDARCVASISRELQTRFPSQVAVAGLFLTLLLAPVAASAYEVISDNYYSMLKVDSTSLNTAFAVPFVKLDATTNPDEHPISVADAVDIRTLAEGDTLMIYDQASGVFDSYEVSPSNTWDVLPVTTMTLSGSLRETVGESASVMSVMPGCGSWLLRKDTPSTLILHGQLPYSAQVTVCQGANLVGTVSLGPIDLNHCSVKWNDLVKDGTVKPTRRIRPGKYDWGDTIVFWTADGKRNQLYYRKDDSDATGRWDNPYAEVTTRVPTGVAFWYEHVDAKDFTYGIEYSAVVDTEEAEEEDAQ